MTNPDGGAPHAMRRRPLDVSLKERIASPSSEFQAFIEQFFLVPMVWARGEQDMKLLDTLQGAERETAAAMILANMRGYEHMIRSAAYMGLREAIPQLQAMRNEPSDAYMQYVIVNALYRLGALPADEFFAFAQASLERCSDILAFTILNDSYRYFDLDSAVRLVETALRRDNYHTRASAYTAARTIEYLRAHGGRYTQHLAFEAWQRQMAMATIGYSGTPWFEQLQYYVGDAVYRDKPLFEQRLGELIAEVISDS